MDKYKNKITFLRTAGILPRCRIRKDSCENNVQEGAVSCHASSMIVNIQFIPKNKIYIINNYSSK